MKNYLIALIAACPVVAAAAQTRPATDYIDPMIGTRSMGHVFPGACVPHGIVQLSPDTEMVPHNIDGKYQPEAAISASVFPSGTTSHTLTAYRLNFFSP